MPVWIRYVLFLLVLLSVLVGTHVFLHRRVAHAFELGPKARRFLGYFLAASVALVITSRVLTRFGRDHETLAAALGVVGFTIALATLLTVILLLPVEPLRWWLRRRRSAAESPTDPSRRDALGTIATATALAVGGGASLFGTLVGRHDYTIETVPLRLEKLPAALDGFTIAQLSDVHIGTYVREGELAAAIDLVRGIRPDLIVLTGDVVDFDPRYSPLLGRWVEQLVPLARHGVAAVLGNHDYYADPLVVLRALRRAGATMLVNEARTIGEPTARFALLGVDDLWARRDGVGGPDLDRALAMTRPDDAKVLLAHNPAFFPSASARVDAQLSGHTHGGQISLGWNPAELVLPFGYVAGRYERDGATLWVNRGFGTAGPPSRVEQSPEVTKIVLTRS